MPLRKTVRKIGKPRKSNYKRALATMFEKKRLWDYLKQERRLMKREGMQATVA